MRDYKMLAFWKPGTLVSTILRDQYFYDVSSFPSPPGIPTGEIVQKLALRKFVMVLITCRTGDARVPYTLVLADGRVGWVNAYWLATEVEHADE